MTKSVGIKTLSCIHIHYPKRDIDSLPKNRKTISNPKRN